jgi:hypothetical protein
MSRSDAMTGSKQLASVAGPGAPGLGRRRRWPRSQIDEISLLVVTLATRAKRKLTCISRMAVNSASLQKKCRRFNQFIKRRKGIGSRRRINLRALTSEARIASASLWHQAHSNSTSIRVSRPNVR